VATLLFIHGTGQRRDSVSRSLEKIRAHAKEQPVLAPLGVENCLWGDRLARSAYPEKAQCTDCRPFALTSGRGGLIYFRSSSVLIHNTGLCLDTKICPGSTEVEAAVAATLKRTG
jgi:hypothetical protein